MSNYDKLPARASSDIEKFKLRIPDEKLEQFKILIKASPIGPVTYENQLKDQKYGVSRDWLANAKKEWETNFDWRAQEDYINSLPQFKTTVTDNDGSKYEIHFMALFSEKKDAVPIAFFHGWPGSFLEFIGVLKTMAKRYTPQTLPYHLIVPSLVGYTLSAGPPTDKDWSVADTSRLMHKLIMSLGFKDGYVSQGGDVGSAVARILAVQNPECKAIHLNYDSTRGKPEGVDDSELTDLEKDGVAKATEWMRIGSAYAMEHGTRPSTIGLALSTSPVALLAWIGEKFLEWTDDDPPLEEILRAVALYWLTDTFPRAIYPYRSFVARSTAARRAGLHEDPDWHITKPLGFSYFPYEIGPTPKAYVAKSGNLVWHRYHDRGGHFAALEKPEEFADDIEDFLKQINWMVED